MIWFKLTSKCNKMIFSHKNLREFFREIHRLGRTELFKNWKGDRVFLLRHDIDFDINLAHKMAQIEAEENLVSTFFILTTCESYNVLSTKNKQLLREILGMGHEVGLHFDPTIYEKDLELAVKQECELLSFAINCEIKSISLHNPSVHGLYPMFENYVNAYDPKMFSNENYISDSRFSFRGKNPFEFIKGIDNSMIQILLHPMHYSELGSGYKEIMFSTFMRYINDVHCNFKTNNVYVEQVGEDINEGFKSFIK